MSFPECNYEIYDEKNGDHQNFRIFYVQQAFKPSANTPHEMNGQAHLILTASPRSPAPDSPDIRARPHLRNSSPDYPYPSRTLQLSAPSPHLHRNNPRDNPPHNPPHNPPTRLNTRIDPANPRTPANLSADA